MNSDAASLAAWKRAAAYAAAELVTDGMIVGIGTGSTAVFAIEALASRMQAGLRFLGIPSSDRSAALATSLGISLTTFADHPRIDLTIDGADEVERGTLNLIKGHGGALLHEKIVASASHRLAIIVDGTKLVDRLGDHSPVPVEIVNFGWEATRSRLEDLGAVVTLRGTPEGTAYRTDSGNRILDCRFESIADPAAVEQRIRRIVGVVECGLFVGLTDVVFMGHAAGVTRLERSLQVPADT